MKILSVRQPWATPIVGRIKDVENRTWRTNYRGPVLVHASLRAVILAVPTLFGITARFRRSISPAAA